MARSRYVALKNSLQLAFNAVKNSFYSSCSPDGITWNTVVGENASARGEVVYEEDLLFDKQRNCKMLSIDMKQPRPWGYYGINQVALLR